MFIGICIRTRARTPTTTPPRAVAMATPLYTYIILYTRSNQFMAQGASADGLSVWGGGAGVRAVYVPAGHILSYEYLWGDAVMLVWWRGWPPRGARDPAGLRRRRRRCERVYAASGVRRGLTN